MSWTPRRYVNRQNKGKWTADEEITLKDSVEKHNGKNWGVIAALVPGRTKLQCRHRWAEEYAAPSRITTTEEENCTTNEAPALG
jgi:hypothetical protein